MNQLKERLNKLKEKNPLILSITNQVTINECANALLAIGASPVMSGEPEDARELAALAAASVLNIGTINDYQLQIILAAAEGANQAQKPTVFDPVGAGATLTRREASHQVLSQVHPQIIRGNFSEIKALLSVAAQQKGVDSDSARPEDAADLASSLASKTGAVVAVTGEVDVICDGRQTYFIEGGHPLMNRITGTGCLLSAMVGAYAGSSPDDLTGATLSALVHLAWAGERAAASLSQPSLGTFRTLIFDQLSNLSGDDLSAFKGVSRR